MKEIEGDNFDISLGNRRGFRQHQPKEYIIIGQLW